VKRNLKPFKIIFKTAGKLRTAQVELEIFRKYFSRQPVNSNYLRHLHEITTQRTQEYIKLLSKLLNGLKESISIVKGALKKLTRKKIKGYLKIEEKKIFRYINKNIFREQRLHIIRKKLKIFYLKSQNCKPCVFQ
jgi:hypothetical protein